jgi:hypothetical protein
VCEDEEEGSTRPFYVQRSARAGAVTNRLRDGDVILAEDEGAPVKVKGQIVCRCLGPRLGPFTATDSHDWSISYGKKLVPHANASISIWAAVDVVL